MKNFRFVIALLCAATLFFTTGAIAATPESNNAIHIDIASTLKTAKVLFNMDHSAFAGDTPIGLAYMETMLEKFKQDSTEWRLDAVFHGAGGYMLLDDEAYNNNRHTKTGNPYKTTIMNLMSRGVLIEECGKTMKANNWTNGNLLPGVKVNSGANFRIVDLVQQGFIMLQP